MLSSPDGRTCGGSPDRIELTLSVGQTYLKTSFGEWVRRQRLRRLRASGFALL
jgi:hypothetical protein